MPKSGNPLELKVPSYSLKALSGWINHSCRVKSFKASEKNEGNRGSKSVISENITEKEQRVNGSIRGINLPCLRCTLTGFERNYHVKAHSNKITQRQFFLVDLRLNYLAGGGGEVPQYLE